jgi:hypothetical protein
MGCYFPAMIRAEQPDRDDLMVTRDRSIADRYRERDVAKKPGWLFGSCVNRFVANLCLALGVGFDYVDPIVSLQLSTDKTLRDVNDVMPIPALQAPQSD